MSSTYIMRENLIAALRLAIKTQTEHEKQYGPDFKSAMVAGWEDVLADLCKGENLEVRG